LLGSQEHGDGSDGTDADDIIHDDALASDFLHAFAPDTQDDGGDDNA